jgi:hypothetical protein
MKSDSYPQLVTYLIDCVSVETDFMAYPTNRGCYGPQLDYIQRGFHTPDVVQPFHMCKNGEFELEVKTTAIRKHRRSELKLNFRISGNISD